MQTEFVDVPLGTFPFVVKFYSGHPDGQDLRHVIEVSGPGALHVPSLRKEGEPLIWVKIEYPDGTFTITDPSHAD